jgi:hypothetical protein
MYQQFIQNVDIKNVQTSDAYNFKDYGKRIFKYVDYRAKVEMVVYVQTELQFNAIHLPEYVASGFVAIDKIEFKQSNS